jgi:hypothetical protein
MCMESLVGRKTSLSNGMLMYDYCIRYIAPDAVITKCHSSEILLRSGLPPLVIFLEMMLCSALGRCWS